MTFFYIFLIVFCLLTNDAHADKACAPQDKSCVMAQMMEIAPKIDNLAWRDQTYRELAKSYTHDGQYDTAISLIDKIDNPDTKAMTIRGIGFAAADAKWPRAKYNDLFEKLTRAGKNILDPAGQSIAFTYIAMAQAMAMDDAGATLTAKSMENAALRNKAYGENAEIQAERGDILAALDSITHIDSPAYKDKAYRNIAKIFVTRGDVQSAYKSAQNITNAYTKTQVLQMIVNHGNPEEKNTDSPHEPKDGE